MELFYSNNVSNSPFHDSTMLYIYQTLFGIALSLGEIKNPYTAIFRTIAK